MTIPGSKLLARLQSIDKLDGVTVSVGLQGRGAASVGPEDKTDNELVIIGRAHEFGVAVQNVSTADGATSVDVVLPERPWLRTALARHGKVWVGGLKTAARQVIGGRPKVASQTLRQVGVVMVGDVQQTIRTGPWVPNADLTIELKGSDKPLIDTAQMVQSVRAAVEGPGMPTEVIG